MTVMRDFVDFEAACQDMHPESSIYLLFKTLNLRKILLDEGGDQDSSHLLTKQQDNLRTALKQKMIIQTVRDFEPLIVCLLLAHRLHCSSNFLGLASSFG
jgi:hypothetical protein